MTRRLQPPTLRLLQLIAAEGPMTVRQAALGSAPPLPVEHARAIVKRLDYTGYIVSDKQEGEPATYAITVRGRQCLESGGAPVAASAKPMGGMALPRDRAFEGRYDGAELRPFEGRPGAMDFKALPSLGMGALPDLIVT